MKYKKILLTGADGFIGSHLAEYLIRKGYSVRCFVLYNSMSSWGWLDTLPEDIRDSLDVFCGDIRDGHGVETAVKGCDAIMHLAALIGIPYSYHSPESYVDTNIKGTLNILQAAVREGCSKVVHTSTSEVYGTAAFVPMTELHPLQAQSPYAATKIAADQLALSFYRSFSLPVSVFRPFNTYGPRQSARAVIPTVITQIAAGLTQIKLGDTRPTRDFSFVADTVSAFEAVLQSDTTIGHVLNGGTGFEISVGEMVALIARLMDTPIVIQHDEQRIRPTASEVMRLFADNTKLRELTGWTPQYAGIEGFSDGLKTTIDWFVNPDNLSRYPMGSYVI